MTAMDGLDAPRSVRLSIPAKPEFVLLGRLATSAVGRLAPLEPAEIDDLKMAVSEAAAAFVGGDSADRADPDRPLDFSFRLDEDSLDVVVECAGGVNLDDEERALGEAVIRATVDEADCDGDRFRLVKRVR
jgi:anti-sigma regulatory factor (Ser/Thr protein kinase)